jgi:hypothetical protein
LNRFARWLVMASDARTNPRLPVSHVMWNGTLREKFDLLAACTPFVIALIG